MVSEMIDEFFECWLSGHLVSTCQMEPTCHVCDSTAHVKHDIPNLNKKNCSWIKVLWFLTLDFLQVLFLPFHPCRRRPPCSLMYCRTGTKILVLTMTHLVTVLLSGKEFFFPLLFLGFFSCLIWEARCHRDLGVSLIINVNVTQSMFTDSNVTPFMFTDSDNSKSKSTRGGNSAGTSSFDVGEPDKTGMMRDLDGHFFSLGYLYPVFRKKIWSKLLRCCPTVLISLLSPSLLPLSFCLKLSVLS